jgi:hypothetical protein
VEEQRTTEQQQAARAVTWAGEPTGGGSNKLTRRWVSSTSLSLLSLSLLSHIWVSPAKGAQVNSEREISRASSPCLWRVSKQGSRLQPISRLQTIPLQRTLKWCPPSSPRRHSDALPASPTPRRPKLDAISATGQARWTPSLF